MAFLAFIISIGLVGALAAKVVAKVFPFSRSESFFLRNYSIFDFFRINRGTFYLMV